MNRFNRMEEFLKCLEDNVNNQERRLSFDEIYSLLNRYDVKEEDLSFDGNPYDFDLIVDTDFMPCVFDNWQSYFNDKEDVLAFNRGYWCQFRNRKVDYKDVNEHIKMYIPLDSEHLEEGVKKIMQFLSDEGIFHISKAGKHIRFDDVVVRLTNLEDASKLANFIKNDSYIQEGLIKPNPFAIEKDGIAYACDKDMSYNSVVASLMKLYINNELASSNDNKIEVDLSLDGFRSFVMNYYNDIAMNPEKRDYLISDVKLCEDRNHINNCMRIIELVYHVLDPSFTYDAYTSFYQANCNDYNRGYELLKPIVMNEEKKEEKEEVPNNSSINTFEKLEILVEELSALVGHRNALRDLGYSVDALDKLIAQKSGEVSAFIDSHVALKNDDVLHEDCKVVKNKSYEGEIEIIGEKRQDLSDKIFLSMTPEQAKEILYYCDRYKNDSLKEKHIEQHIFEMDLGNEVELLKFVKSDNPDEFSKAFKVYKDLIISRSFAKDDISVKASDCRFDFDDRDKMQVSMEIPKFEYGEEYTVAPGDVELKIKVGGEEYDESVDGPLYSARINIDASDFVEVPFIGDEIIQVSPSVKVNFDADIEKYVSGKKYCIYDAEKDILIRFEFNLVKYAVLEREHLEVEDKSREEQVEELMLDLMPWLKGAEVKKKSEEEKHPDIIFDIKEVEEEKIAREKLHHCKLFDGVDDKDFMIDSIINSNANKLGSAKDIINMLKEDDPKMYQDMENNYANSKKNGVSSGVSMQR